MTPRDPDLVQRLRGRASRALDALRAAVQLASPIEVTPEVATDLVVEDIQLDAHTVLHKRGIGWEIDLIDVREPAEIAASGAVDGATAVPLSAVALTHPATSVDRTVVLICASGERSGRAALALRAQGHPDVWSLSGGVEAWVRAGGALERG